MSAIKISQFAVELKMPVMALLEQLSKAGVGAQNSEEFLTDQDKAKLLEYLRRSHGDESKAKITLTRKETSEIKATDAHGRARTVQVEVRKKRVLVKREVGEHAAEQQGQTDELPVDATDLEHAVSEPVVEIAPIPEPEPEPIPEPTPEPEPEPEPIPEPTPEPIPEPVVVVA